MHLAKITVFAGHFGSGKTSLAIAYAMWVRQQRDRVILCDLDIVNPYFRTADAADALAESGIRLITSRFANTNVDAPALPAETRVLFDDDEAFGVIDLGGDDRGALALGRYAKLLQSSAWYEMLLVINRYRPLTRDIGDLRSIKDEIEAAGKVPFTGLVNNSNLATETTLQDVIDTAAFAAEVSDGLTLPIKMTSLDARLVQNVEAEDRARRELGEIFPMDPYKKHDWRL